MADPSPPPRLDEPTGRAAEQSAEADCRPAEQSAEADCWARVEARWGEPAAHQAYLARFPDLDGLTTAGRRYRDVLAARPGDAVALSMKAEILKRATVVGLSMLPRTAPPPAADGRWKRRALLLLAAWLGSTLAYVLWKLLHG